MKKLLVILSFVSLSVVSCGGGGGGSSNPPPPAISMSVSPSSQTVPAGGTQQFTATVQNTSNQAVTWQVNGVTGGNATVGTISSSGLFTAPALPPSGGSATVTAVSQADSSKSASAAVTIAFSNGSVNGRYAFTFSGVDSAGEFFIAGSIQADGNGNITNGIEDLNHATGVFPSLAFTGTYSVGPDGRGSATTTSSQGTSTLSFVLDNQGRAAIIAFDSNHGSGTLQNQDTSAFSSTAIAGNWSFSFRGINSSGAPAAAAGRFSLDAAGTVSAGVEDFNNAGVVSSNATFTGSSSVSSSGRGTATLTGGLGASQLAFYVVSANEAVFVSLDFPSGFLGSAAKQQSASFSLSSLNGNYAFLLAGASTLGAVVDAGRFTADGNGNLSSGVFDVNDTGVVAQNQSFTGTYSLAANGRGTATVTSAAGSSSFAFYMVSQERAFFVETDATAVTVGRVLAQKGSPFFNSSVSGNFDFFLTGATVSGLTDIVGQLTANGSGGFTAGTEDTHIGSTLTTAASITGTYSVGSNGRGTATITFSGTTSNFAFYVVDSSTVVIVGVDPNELLFGAASKQFPEQQPGPWDY